jgi:hypothetical protein
MRKRNGNNGNGRSIARTLADTALIERTLGKAVREALLRHKRAGNPVASWRNGKAVWIQPEDIDV